MLLEIKGYEDYVVDEWGAVTKVKGSYQGLIKHQKVIKGYVMVGLRNKGKRKFFRVHRLVAQAFLPNYSQDLQVNHLDGNKLNNHVSNLEMCTATENKRHAKETGLFDNRGVRHNLVKLSEEDVKWIRQNKTKYTGVWMANKYEVSTALISLIKANKLWRHL